MNPTSLQRKEAQKRNDEFAPGDLVIITRRFFSNHGIHYQDLGIAAVREYKPPYMSYQPSVTIDIKFNSFLVQCSINGWLKAYSLSGINDREEITVMVEIHPAYLEKIKQKKRK